MSANGGLIQLVAFGTKKALLRQDFNGISYSEINIEKFGNLDKTHDLITPLYLIIDASEYDKELSIDNFHEHFTSTKIMIGTNAGYWSPETIFFLNVNLNFLTKLNPIKKIGDKFAIKLPIDSMFGKLIQTSKIAYEMANVPEKIRLSLCIEGIFLDTHVRQEYLCRYGGVVCLTLCSVPNIVSNKKIYYGYIVEPDNNYVGLFLEFDSEVKQIKIQYLDKMYCIDDLERMSDKLYYFSPSKLKFKDRDNLIKPPTIIPNTKITVVSDSEIVFHFTKKIVLQCSQLFTKILDKFDPEHNYLEDLDNNYSTLKTFSKTPVSLEKIFRSNVKTFSKCEINQKFIDENIVGSMKSIRFCECKFVPDVKIPKTVKTIMLEGCTEDLYNLPRKLKKLWLLDSANQTNLPFELKKIYLYGAVKNNSTTELTKVPYGCQVINIE